MSDATHPPDDVVTMVVSREQAEAAARALAHVEPVYGDPLGMFAAALERALGDERRP